jgi:hypothetical protein
MLLCNDVFLIMPFSHLLFEHGLHFMVLHHLISFSLLILLGKLKRIFKIFHSELALCIRFLRLHPKLHIGTLA